jgi:hypothetical protein
VREPLSWYASWWQHSRVIDHSKHLNADFYDWPPNRYVNLPFEQYLLGCITCLPGFLSWLYTGFVGVPGSSISFIGRYERSAYERFYDISSRIGKPRA